jgi:uncharacterized protein (DUF1697 family)
MGGASTHIALIRGINVGRNKRVAMADLRELLTSLGYGDVRTLLQSGNAVFSAAGSAAAVAQAVEEAMTEQLKVSARVLIRSPALLARAIEADPFGERAAEGSKHFLGFLDGRPDQATVDAVPALAPVDRAADTATDEARFVDGHLYLWCPNGISKSTLWQVNWDRSLGTAVTLRNWNTVTKLLELAG